MATTSIEWTRSDDGTPGVVWNPTTGCDKVSPGCGLPRWEGDKPHGQCYALTMAKRLKAMGQAKYQTDGDPRTSGPGFGVAVHEDALTIPLGWKKPRRVFVNSMSDLFHDRVPDEFIARVFAVMAASPQHTFQVLTKRHGRMRSLLSGPGGGQGFRLAVKDEYSRLKLAGRLPGSPLVINCWPLPNVWLGVSVEDQHWADIRIPALLGTPAVVRWLSCEPLLGPVDLWRHLFPAACATGCGCRWPTDPDARECACDGDCCMHPDWPFDSGIHWVVAGGESGPNARPMHPDWPRDLRDQCAAGGVPFFFKQWGEWAPSPGGTSETREQVVWDRPAGELDRRWAQMRRFGKKAAGRELDGRTEDEYPEVRHAG